MKSELYKKKVMAQRRLRIPKGWHEQWTVGLDGTEKLLESVNQRARTGLEII